MTDLSLNLDLFRWRLWAPYTFGYGCYPSAAKHHRLGLGPISLTWTTGAGAIDLQRTVTPS